MIKLFRNIRKNLLNEGKTSKYFKYAIGEIILVVIGILIALQINNWNELRKQNIEEKAILESLYENLILAKKQSEGLISKEVEMKKDLIYVLDIDTRPSKNKLNTLPDSIFKNAVWDITSDMPVVNTYFNLKNTNKISLIQNKTITEKFTNLEVHFTRLENILADRIVVHQTRVDNIAENEINFIPLLKSQIPHVRIVDEISNKYEEILKDKKTRNLLAMKLSITHDVISFRENLDKEIKELTQLIQSELKNQ